MIGGGSVSDEFMPADGLLADVVNHLLLGRRWRAMCRWLPRSGVIMLTPGAPQRTTETTKNPLSPTFP
ncbi:hypothetical protein GCM10010103_26870 [Streptomyces paradoxus]